MGELISLELYRQKKIISTMSDDERYEHYRWVWTLSYRPFTREEEDWIYEYERWMGYPTE